MLLIALLLIVCLSLLLKLVWATRSLVTQYCTTMALDVSMWILILNLVLAQHLGILNMSWMPCSCLATPSCSLFHHLQVINLIIMVDLDLRLGCLLLLNLWLWLRFLLLHQLLGWAH
ncbi:hypothetical protein PVAP13_2NG501315 [Panicum virgatum]|uniref:Secreted peptide n=1 Tax=Panicum virgatum TaxID=38727 RepID=A0A8T0VRS9_PANVG|nr:hypothetical protein PVAP13_2NG501315 [Panicum virgatum]